MRWQTKRVLQSVVTVFVVVNITFGLIRLMPGGPTAYLKSQVFAGGSGSMSEQRFLELAELYINYNPNATLWEQYVDYMSAVLFRFDLGTSVWYDEAVSKILLEALPWTVFVMTASLVLMFAIGIGLGAIMAYNEGSKMDVASTLYSTVSTSIPYYVTAVVFLFIFAYQFGWFPTGGRMDDTTTIGLNWPFFAGVLHHAALPIASTVLTGFGGWALSMRGNSIRVLGEDYLRVARLRGLKPRRIAFDYVGRNAILPMYTGLMITVGFLFGGSVILEQIFNYQGIGYYMFEGISARDYPLMMGAFMLITFAVIAGILFADLTYGYLDPRAGGGETRETY